MSLSSRDRLLIGLAPSGVSLLRMRGLLRPRIFARHSADCEPAGGGETWQAAIAALRAALDAMRNDKAAATVVLSNHFVRYALLPWSDSLRRPEEEQAYAKHHFQRIFGERAKGWVLRNGDGPRGGLRLVTAVDAGLLEALTGSFPQPGGLRLVSVQPYLMAAYNRWRRAFPASGAWFLLLEPGRACLALQAGGQWRALHCVRRALDSPDDLADFLERERLQLGGDAPDLVLLHGERVTREVQGAPGWQVKHLSHSEGRYAAALSAA